MKTKTTNENLVNKSNQPQRERTNYEKLTEEVYDYVINDVYEGDKDLLFTEIVNKRGFGGSPWCKYIPDWVREMDLPFDYVIQDDWNDLSTKLWDLETKPYFENISTTDYPEYYDGFNKPSEEWSDKEWEISWDYHMESESCTEIYLGFISLLSIYVEEYLLKKQHKRIKEILKTFISSDEIEDKYYGYYETTDSNDDVYEYELDTDNYNFRIVISSGIEGDLDISVTVEKIKDGWSDETLYEFDSSSLEKLESELVTIINFHNKVIKDKETEKSNN